MPLVSVCSRIALLVLAAVILPALIPAPAAADPAPATEEQEPAAAVPLAAEPTPNLLALGWPPIQILGTQIEPGEKHTLALRLTDSVAGSGLNTPVVVVHGVGSGPAVCLTGGIHGDEINGMEIVRRVVEDLDPTILRGTVIGVPIVNLHGFQRGSRYLPDRRDLNRFFPGNAYGSSASRIAHLLFEQVIRHCEALIDYHTGSLHRTNLPQVRGDLREPEVRRLAERFNGTVLVHNRAKKGTIRQAAMNIGIPAIIYEAGEPMRLQEDEIARGVAGTIDLLAALAMLTSDKPAPQPEAVYLETRWVRVNDGGLLHSRVQLGDEVRQGEILGHVRNPVQRDQVALRSRYSGRIIGMTVSPIMIPGYAAYHIGLSGEAKELVAPDPGQHSLGLIPRTAIEDVVHPVDSDDVDDDATDHAADTGADELPEDERPE